MTVSRFCCTARFTGRAPKAGSYPCDPHTTTTQPHTGGTTHHQPYTRHTKAVLPLHQPYYESVAATAADTVNS